jgi:hypothetical protein
VQVVGERSICVPQDARVVMEARKNISCMPPGMRIQRKARGKRHCASFETLDAEKLVAERRFAWRRRASPQTRQQVW